MKALKLCYNVVRHFCFDINKARHKSWATDQHLRFNLRIATTKLTPDVDAPTEREY